jgi:RNA polymerase sigma-70 factor (ECF subfamily)
MSGEPRQPGDAGAALDVLARARAGDPEALEELVLGWQPRVRNLVRYLVRGDQQVDDLAQQALLTALEKLPSYRGEGALEAWLDGIVLRVTLRSMRRFRLLRAREVAQPDPGQHVASTDAVRYRDRRKLAHALDQLPHKQRSALVMRHVLGMSAREIAELEGIPEETARSRLKHGMALLRASFGLEGDAR